METAEDMQGGQSCDGEAANPTWGASLIWGPSLSWDSVGDWKFARKELKGRAASANGGGC